MKNKATESNNESKSFLLKIGKFNLTWKAFWIIAVIYSSIVLILKYKFHSKIAEFLYQISFLAAIIIIIFVIYRILKVIAIDLKNKYF